MRMRIYHNLDLNQLEAYVLADENRALSGQKKSIREALPECVTEMRKLCIDLAAAATATIYADGYGAIVVTWNAGLMSNAMLLHAGSRERLCNRKLARNKDIEVTTSDDLASALATVLRSEAACRRANDLDTAVRFAYPAETNTVKRVASWQSTRWTLPTPLAETPADAADDDAADVAADVDQAETTVIVEPVEVEHDGVIDVEMAETAEIPAVTTTQATDEPDQTGPHAALYRNTFSSEGNSYMLVVDGCGMSVGDAAAFVADYVRNNIHPNFMNVGMESAFRVMTDAHVNVDVKICGVGGVRAVLEYHRRDDEFSYRCFSVWAENADYFGKARRDGGVTDAWDKTVSFARGIEIALKRDKLTHKHDGSACAALIDTYDEAIGYKDTSEYVERVVSLPTGGFVEPDASDKPASVSAEPRAVVSAPVLPAECSAETVEIPEVPPTTNSDAHVLAVSEDVIPTNARVRDVFPDVPYRAVHAIRRVIENSDGTVSKKKVAYVFRHGDEIQVLRRDRYESAGRDAAVEAEIAAHVARLQRAA